ncbi:TMEM164 family-domain-containing protein [Phascolomyces articulosus]|uniref:TMEM164 family-domain-containing protein n=1 Tax=Phascolomyces articulosus TaxID=60185 RepID=A0AAD5K6C1_9FUNG|nr:TMEM164 family-domain-containing protein [Phascolomyces articulosus]
MAPVISLLRNVWDPVANRLERLVRKIAVELPIDNDWSQSIKGSWYVHPRQHAIEIVFLSSAFASAASYFFMRALGPDTLNFKLLTSFIPTTPASWTEKLLLGSLIGSLGLTLTHKLIRGTGLFMLQPCHMGALLLISVMSAPEKLVSKILFNIYLHTQWGGYAALAFPDLRGHDLFLETFNFFAEHALILVAPIYMIYSGRYLVLPASPNMALLSFFVYGFFHSPLLHTCALRSGLNLNYLFAPPPSKYKHGFISICFWSNFEIWMNLSNIFGFSE